MGPMRNMFRPKADLLALEANVERAGTALACPFTSSAEFEAAIVRARRAAGAYGPKRRQRVGMFAVAALIALLIWIV